MADDKAEAGAKRAANELDKAHKAEQDAGYAGTKVDPRDNSEYSLESGPESPSALEASVDAAKARVDELEAAAA